MDRCIINVLNVPPWTVVIGSRNRSTKIDKKTMGWDNERVDDDSVNLLANGNYMTHDDYAVSNVNGQKNNFPPRQLLNSLDV